MRRGGLICFLLAGCVSVCHLHTDGVRSRFRIVDSPKNWTDAHSYCREKFVDFAIIQDETENQEAKALLSAGKFWIGLKRSWRWSHSGQDFSTDSLLAKWAPNEPGNGLCVSVSPLGWHTPGCSTLHPVLCYSAASQKHILVQKPMKWSDAQKYCRSLYTDMSSILSQQDSDEILRLLQDPFQPAGAATEATKVLSHQDSDEILRLLQDPFQPAGGATEATMVQEAVSEAWLGLQKRTLWTDLKRGSYRPWAAGQKTAAVECVLMEASTGDWSSAPCSEQHGFLCDTGDTHSVVTSVVTSLKLRLSAGTLDLNDPDVQLAVLQQLKQKLVDGGVGGELKLRWRTQPDGQVFHKEEEQSAPPAGPDDTAVRDREL